MRQGEIRWYKFGAPDKKRPVLILTRDSILEYINEATIAPITSTVRDIPSEVFLSRGEGMKKDCAVNCDHIQTVGKSKIGAIIATLSQEKIEEVRKAILFALNL